MQNKKVLVVAFIATGILSLGGVNAYAGNAPGLSGVGQVVDNSSNSSLLRLGINADTATAKLTVTAKEANRIDATVYLQKNSSGSWKNVKMWSKSVYGTDTMSFIRSASVKKGKYRAKATVSVSKGAKTETNTIYSSTVTY